VRYDATIKRWYQKKCASSLALFAIKAVAHKLARACYYVMDGRISTLPERLDSEGEKAPAAEEPSRAWDGAGSAVWEPAKATDFLGDPRKSTDVRGGSGGGGGNRTSERKAIETKVSCPHRCPQNARLI
jgi:hypothetical protein